MSEQSVAATPYKGLMPYSEEDAPFFFGRDAEREIIIANLLATRLTLLYGPSGVGKSSVLRAGVAHHLRRLARENLDETGSPQLTVAVFNSWRDDPVAGLEARVRDSALKSLNGQKVEPVPPSRSLLESFKAWSERVGGDLLIILDQFEEYFLYHDQDGGAESFAVQFPRIVKTSDLSVHFLISIRDDALAKLDFFQGQIPALFDNRLGIDHLDRNAAREAIQQPIEQFNRLYAAGRQRINIEPALVEAVLDQVKTGEVMVGETGRGVVRGQSETERIETPYLQLVMNRLWEEDIRAGSQTLRLKTLENLHGARQIVRTHLDKAMNELPPSQQEVAASVFHYLVTPSGSKIAHTVPDLAEYSQLPRPQLLAVMEKLSGGDIRILRGVIPPPDQPDEPRYEIFHDVLAAAILDWRRRYVQARQEQRSRRSRRRAIAMVAVLLLVLAGGAIAWIEYQNSRELNEIQLKANEEKEKKNDELEAVVEAQAEIQQSLVAINNLSSDNAETRSEAITTVKKLAENGKLSSDLLPTIKETIKRNATSDTTATLKYIEAALKTAPKQSNADAAKLPPRVYIHIRDDQQRDMATQVRQGLQKAGYVVPGIQLVSDGPPVNQLRYFRDEDQADANSIINILGTWKFTNAPPARIKGYEDSTLRARQFEIWFGGPKKDTPQQSGGTPAQKGDTTQLTIKVLDLESGQQIVGARVSVIAAQAPIQTDFRDTKITGKDGIATFADVPRDLIVVEVSAKGFQTSRDRYKVKTETFSSTIQLRKD